MRGDLLLESLGDVRGNRVTAGPLRGLQEARLRGLGEVRAAMAGELRKRRLELGGDFFEGGLKESTHGGRFIAGHMPKIDTPHVSFANQATEASSGWAVSYLTTPEALTAPVTRRAPVR